MPPKDMTAAQSAPAIDPNLVTAEIATTGVQPAPEPAVEVAVEAVEPGAVLKKGAPPPAPKPGTRDEGLVTVRITKKGHGEVHDGNDGRYDWNDLVALPRSVGKALEDRGYAEIQE